MKSKTRLSQMIATVELEDATQAFRNPVIVVETMPGEAEGSSDCDTPLSPTNVSPRARWPRSQRDLFGWDRFQRREA